MRVTSDNAARRPNFDLSIIIMNPYPIFLFLPFALLLLTCPLASAIHQSVISTPTLLIDKMRVLENIRRMALKAKQSSTRLRPHCKTHASLEIARWLREEGGVSCITVSSLTMAKYFSSEWDDITVAFPVNILELETIQELIDAGIRLNLLLENIEAVDYLEEKLRGKVGFYLKIDVGYGRTGIPADDIDRIDSILTRAASCQNVSFLGFLTHAGHTYHATSQKEILEIHNASKKLLLGLKERYIGRFPNLILSMGDTPSCSVADVESWKEIDEMRPGNFVFYDLEQAHIGSCSWNDIAVAVACPIVAKHPHRRELTLYGGGVHFAKDKFQESKEGESITVCGRVVHRTGDLTWGPVMEGVYVRSLSQEHGMVVVPSEKEFESFKVGDIVMVLPVHSCMTADVMKKGYLTTEGEHIERMRDS